MAVFLNLTTGVVYLRGGGSSGSFTSVVATGDVSTTNHFYAGDGTALLPAFSFTSEPTLGFWRSVAGTMTFQGSLATTGYLFGGAGFNIGVGGGNVLLNAAATGQLGIRNAAGSAGVGLDLTTDATLKVRTRAQADTAILDVSHILAGDGTGPLPTYSFASEPTLGFYRINATNIALAAGSLLMTAGNLTVANSGAIIFNGRGGLNASADGLVVVRNQGNTIGTVLKADALPTIASGFGAAAAVTAGSSPLAGSVGTGAASASGVINFNGTAFASAPYPVCMNQTTGLAVKATATTTQLTITPATGNFGANDVISWVCMASK